MPKIIFTLLSFLPSLRRIASPELSWNSEPLSKSEDARAQPPRIYFLRTQFQQATFIPFLLDPAYFRFLPYRTRIMGLSLCSDFFMHQSSIYSSFTIKLGTVDGVQFPDLLGPEGARTAQELLNSRLERFASPATKTSPTFKRLS